MLFALNLFKLFLFSIYWIREEVSTGKTLLLRMWDSIASPLLKLTLTSGSLALVCKTVLAQVPTAPDTVDQALGWVPQLIAKFATGNSVDALAGYGILVMILMVAVRQYVLPKAEIPSDWLPTVSVFISAITALALKYAVGLAGAEVAIGDALKTALVGALFSGITWDWIGQKAAKAILGDKYAEPAKPAA